jgi:hypothetical protein
MAALAFGVVGSIIIGWSNAATNNFTNVVEDPIDPKYLTEIPFGARSDWIQPWRAYMDTVPASTLVSAVGINFNVSGNTIEPTARLLAANGFTRARIEIGWNNMDYDNPGTLTAASQQKIDQYITTFKKYGIRPLILLNANSGGPVPAKNFTVNVTRAAKTGDTTIKLDPAAIPQVVRGYSGSKFSDSSAAQAKYRFTSIAADGTATLSFPLRTDVPVAAYPANTQKFQPFFPPTKDDGSPSPEYNATMNGWLQYTGAVTKAVKQAYGSDNFDVEIWNELSFGSAFLGYGNYFSPLPAGYTKGSGATSNILLNTIDYLKNPANGVSNVKIGNGFTNQSPWGSGVNSPVGLSAIDKHPYSGPRFRPYEGQGGVPIDALGERDPTAVYSCVQEWNHTIQTPWTDTNSNGKLDNKDACSGGFIGQLSPKEPTYNLVAPESFLTGVTTETLSRDLAPFDNPIQGTPHGRNTRPCPTCEAPVMWITEVNLSPYSASVIPDPAKPGSYLSVPRTAAEADHIGAKNDLRYLVSFVNKGVKALHFYGANAGTLSIINKSFFDQLNAGDIKHNPSFYPGDSTGGVGVDAIRNLTGIMKQGMAPLTKSRQLSLDKIADNHNHKQFEKTDDTPAHAPLYDRDVLAVLPFQVNDHRFAIPAYVMTRDTTHIYNQNAPADGSRFDLPPEAFQLTMSGFDTTKDLSASAIDPLTNTATPVSIVSRTGGTIVIQADLTDSPRIIVIDETGSSSNPAPADTTPPETLITVYPTGSRERTEATFSFAANENGSTFECKLDGGSFSACTSPKTYTAVPAGTHTFSVRAIDAAGNVDPTPEVHTFTFTAPAGTPPPTTTTNPKLGDITGPSGTSDGKIDVFDLSYIIRNYNTSTSKADITGPSGTPDGKVDVFDLSFIIRNYGK